MINIIHTSNLHQLTFFRKRIPAFECEPGCHDCCGPVTTSSLEMARLPLKSEAEHDAALAALSCPHLGQQGCQVYDERPLICRMFGTTPRLACPRGKRPAHMLEPELERRLDRFFAATRQVLV
jgi:Fe-S-cluster containining protein